MKGNTRLLWRLIITAAAAMLLLLGLAYWWQGNLFHEIVGTLMFLLLIGHNVINRWWYGTILRTPPDRRRRILVVVNLALLLPMLVLLVTSIAISQSLFAFLSMQTSFTVRQVHVLAAYWALVVFSIHLGLHWPIVMNAIARMAGFVERNRLRTTALRLVAGATALYGLIALATMDLGSKLINRTTMDMWDFQNGAVLFLINFATIVGLFATLTHYLIQLLTRTPQTSRRSQLAK